MIPYQLRINSTKAIRFGKIICYTIINYSKRNVMDLLDGINVDHWYSILNSLPNPVTLNKKSVNEDGVNCGANLGNLTYK